ncbi:MAG: transposase [Desulfobacteraceae bacterium]|nr:transposase [Desulfobacteraceae bacterium]
MNFFDKNTNIYIGCKDAFRLVTEAVLRMARSGAQWRLLPEKYGNGTAFYRRFARRSIKGVWEAFISSVSETRIRKA